MAPSRRSLPWWVNRNLPRAPAASFVEERCGRARVPPIDYPDNPLSRQEGGQNWTPISPLKGVKFRRRLTGWPDPDRNGWPESNRNRWPDHVGIRTEAEAKAISRLLAAGIEQVEADPTPVRNEATMRRAIEAAKRGAGKIVAAMASAGTTAAGT